MRACALLLLIPHTQVCGTPDYFAPELVEIAQRPEMDGGSFKAMGEESGPHSIPTLSLLLLSLASHLTSLSNHSRTPGAGGYGPPLDCWAVGCIVYELLSGGPPYQARDEEVLFYKISENQMEFPPEVCVHEQAASRKQRAISTLLQPFSFHTSRTHASLHCPLCRSSAT